MELELEIRKYLADNLLYVDQDFEYDNDCSFIGEGLIDSMGVMELVAYVHSSFGVSVAQQDVTPENFDSVNKLASFIRHKLALSSNGNPEGENDAGPAQLREKQVSTSR